MYATYPHARIRVAAEIIKIRKRMIAEAAERRVERQHRSRAGANATARERLRKGEPLAQRFI